MIGPTGSGKTVLQGFLVSQAQKHNPHCLIFDKDRGLEILIRAMNGRYFTLKKGLPTGFNPFHLDKTLKNKEFLYQLVNVLGKPTSQQHEKDLVEAVDGVLDLELGSRKISSLLSFLDPTEQEGPRAHLEKWCDGGRLSWVFDNENDLLDLSHPMTGIDVTEFLDHPEIREPIMMYLFERMESVIDGRRFIGVLAETWKMLGDPYFEKGD